MTGEQWEQAFAGFESSDLARENLVLDGVEQTRYSFGDDFSFAVPAHFEAADLATDQSEITGLVCCIPTPPFASSVRCENL